MGVPNVCYPNLIETDPSFELMTSLADIQQADLAGKYRPRAAAQEQQVQPTVAM